MTTDRTLTTLTEHLSVRSLAEFAALLVSAGCSEPAAGRLTELGARWVPAADTVTLTGRRGGQLVLSAAATALGHWMAGLEEEFGNGPVREAMARSVPVTVADTALDPRWGQLPGEMRDAGVRSVHAVPVPPVTGGEDVRAVVAAYSTDVHAFDDEQEGLGSVGDGATGEPSTPDLSRPVGDLQAALADRAVIGRAVGIVMALRGCTAAQARAHLRHRAHAERSTVLQVARGVVDPSADGPARGDR